MGSRKGFFFMHLVSLARPPGARKSLQGLSRGLSSGLLRDLRRAVEVRL